MKGKRVLAISVSTHRFDELDVICGESFGKLFSLLALLAGKALNCEQQIVKWRLLLIHNRLERFLAFFRSSS
jgi:hypothetical protein